MGERNVVVVVVDGLRADALGAYGNARADTPFLDRLATVSILYDAAFCLDPHVESFYRSLLGGTHPWYRYAGIASPGQPNEDALLDYPAAHHLFTDDESLAGLCLNPFAWQSVHGFSAGTTVAQATSEQGIKRFFQSASDWLQSRLGMSDESEFGWVHLAALSNAGFDPGDDRGAQIERYAAQVTGVDAGIETFFTSILPILEENLTLFVVIGARGYALDERGHTGMDPPLLHEELLHVPLLVYSPDDVSAPNRVDQLTSPLRLGTKLAHWISPRSAHHDHPMEAHSSLVRGQDAGRDSVPEYLCFANFRGDRAIRTPGWYFVKTHGDKERQGYPDDRTLSGSLYLKPDDRWEFNEILHLRPEIGALLDSKVHELARQASAGTPFCLGSLPGELMLGE